MCIVAFVSSACIWIEVRGVYERRGKETHPLVWCGVDEGARVQHNLFKDEGVETG